MMDEKQEAILIEKCKAMTPEELGAAYRDMTYKRDNLKADILYLESCISRLAKIELDLEYHTNVVKDIKKNRNNLCKEIRIYSTKIQE